MNKQTYVIFLVDNDCSYQPLKLLTFVIPCILWHKALDKLWSENISFVVFHIFLYENSEFILPGSLLKLRLPRVKRQKDLCKQMSENALLPKYESLIAKLNVFGLYIWKLPCSKRQKDLCQHVREVFITVRCKLITEANVLSSFQHYLK